MPLRGGGIDENPSNTVPSDGEMSNCHAGGGGAGVSAAAGGRGGIVGRRPARGAENPGGVGVGGSGANAAAGGGGGIVGRRAGRGGEKPGGIGGGGGGVTFGPRLRTRVGSSSSSSSIGIKTSTARAPALAGGLLRGSNLWFSGPTASGLTTSLPLVTTGWQPPRPRCTLVPRQR
jgi:hypothetical protein